MCEERKLLTIDEIRNLENLNEEMIKEYCRLGEERLKDCLETKKQLEQKSFILLSGYITISLALFSMVISNIASIILGFSACILLIAIFFLLWSINLSEYGNIGRHPDDFLKKNKYNYLTIDKKSQAFIYAYNLEYLYNPIEASNISNEKKKHKIMISIYLGVLSIIPLFFTFVSFVYHLF